MSHLQPRPSRFIAALSAVTALAALTPTAGAASLRATSPADKGVAAAAAPTTLAATTDQADRVTVPVRINGQGPFDFVIDTGADRTAISRELAQKLGLAAGPSVMLHATNEDALESTAVLETLEVGQRQVAHVEAALLSEADLGASGLLGIDALRKQAIVLDFKLHRVRVEVSHPEPIDPHVVVVYGKSLYGQLILVDASADRIPLYVILDTGAQNTVVNENLGRRLAIRDRSDTQRRPVDVVSVTGGKTPGEFLILPHMTLGGVALSNVPVAVAELKTFARFGLQDRPAMLLGMDVLRAFQRVSVDFGRKKVSLYMKHE